eukprot:TRINITY_DN57440_c0_g1_i1.p1 TRINITY_DN57440_c0_g1~~TRINITY_DN57440_c0_g1_i1.p1  ORF type:complete len:264 (+),score=49.09 TRINITY_DN57440_c0_g1_i1:90-881(+)
MFGMCKGTGCRAQSFEDEEDVVGVSHSPMLIGSAGEESVDGLVGLAKTSPVEELIKAAASGKALDVAEILQGPVDVNAQNAKKETALLKAADEGRKAIVDLLVSARADPNIVDSKGKTALRRAFDNEEIAGALLTARADPNSSDSKTGCTVMQRAAEGGHVDVILLLLEARGDPNKANAEGETPLHDAATFSQPIVAEALLRAGADHRAVDCSGNTPLLCCAFAADTGSAEVVADILLNAGADPLVVNSDGQSYSMLVEQRKS